MRLEPREVVLVLLVELLVARLEVLHLLLEVADVCLALLARHFLRALGLGLEELDALAVALDFGFVLRADPQAGRALLVELGAQRVGQFGALLELLAALALRDELQLERLDLFGQLPLLLVALFESLVQLIVLLVQLLVLVLELFVIFPERLQLGLHLAVVTGNALVHEPVELFAEVFGEQLGQLGVLPEVCADLLGELDEALAQPQVVLAQVRVLALDLLNLPPAALWRLRLGGRGGQGDLRHRRRALADPDARREDASQLLDLSVASLNRILEELGALGVAKGVQGSQVVHPHHIAVGQSSCKRVLEVAVLVGQSAKLHPNVVGLLHEREVLVPQAVVAVLVKVEFLAHFQKLFE